jgi:LCP family protein required for cell wall assembly
MKKTLRKPTAKKPSRPETKQDKAFRTLATNYYKPQSKAEADRILTDQELEGSHLGRKIFLILLILILAPIITILAWDLLNFSNASKKLFGTSSVIGLFPPSQLDDEKGRVNMLLVGYSRDDPGHAGSTMTDSILLLSIDKSNPKKSYMLSLPRDLYIDIPNYGMAKINEAYQAGQTAKFREAGYPAGGMGLLRKVVGDSLGIDIHYHALINYGSVRDIVDALDGIVITLKSPDKRGVFDPNFQPHEGGPLKLKNGRQKIDGVTALKLTRARGATYGSYGFPQSDFNRTQNQHLVAEGILNELNWKLVLDPRTNGKIFNATAENVKTDVRLSEVIPMYRLLTETPTKDLRSFTLRELAGQNFLTGYTTEGGQSALVPTAGVNNFTYIQSAIARLNK